MNATKERVWYLDILRIIAIIMVLYNHRACYEWFRSCVPLSLSFIVTYILSMLSKCGPPLFFMISGALLLAKDEPIEVTLSHRIIRMLIVMLLISLWIQRNTLGIHSVLHSFFHDVNWYLYQYVAFLLMLPLLRALVKSINREQVCYWFAGVSLLSAYGALLWLKNGEATLFPMRNLPLFAANWASDCWHIIFPLAGYFLSRNDSDASCTKGTVWWKAVMVGSALSIMLSLVLSTMNLRLALDRSYEMLRQQLIFLPACAIFLLCRDGVQLKATSHIAKPVMWVSSATFGMFLLEVHSSISGRLEMFLRASIPAFISSYWVALLCVVLEFLLYSVAAGLARKLPGLKKLI